MDLFLIAAAFVYGSAYGSFLNVLVHRLPREESVVRPRSRCPRCGSAIAWRDNIPVLSWILLGGRCRGCRKPISARYPAVEAASGLMAAALWAKWGASWPVFAAGAALACGALLALALIDWDTFIIPDELSLGLAVAGFAFSPFNPYFDPGPFGDWWAAPARSAVGALFGFLLGWGLAAAGEAIFKKEALGGGDVKLLAGVGAWSGALGAFDCLMIGSFLGAAYGLKEMLGGRVKRGDPIPFGPFLAAGAAFNFWKLLPLGWPLF
jgi:leader peptidase (prepilin peptidase) / N-methyltransferase